MCIRDRNVSIKWQKNAQVVERSVVQWEACAKRRTIQRIYKPYRRNLLQWIGGVLCLSRFWVKGSPDSNIVVCAVRIIKLMIRICISWRIPIHGFAVRWFFGLRISWISNIREAERLIGCGQYGGQNVHIAVIGAVVRKGAPIISAHLRKEENQLRRKREPLADGNIIIGIILIIELTGWMVRWVPIDSFPIIGFFCIWFIRICCMRHPQIAIRVCEYRSQYKLIASVVICKSTPPIWSQIG